VSASINIFQKRIFNDEKDELSLINCGTEFIKSPEMLKLS
jgi:hypothetical protein